MRLVAKIFFFQAEYGIRDLVGSRGLGDVYKRQHLCPLDSGPLARLVQHIFQITWRTVKEKSFWLVSVSYTHLTLPTSDLV